MPAATTPCPMSALLLATQARILALGIVSAAQIGLGEDGQPPASAGQTFVRISPGSVSSKMRVARARPYGIRVTITVKTAVAPADRLAAVFIQSTSQLYDLEQRIFSAVHESYEILNDANVRLGDAVSGFLEPPVHQGTGDCEARRADWFHSDIKGGNAASGQSLTMRFGEAYHLALLTIDEDPVGPTPPASGTHSLDFSNPVNSGYVALFGFGLPPTRPAGGTPSADFTGAANSGYVALLGDF